MSAHSSTASPASATLAHRLLLAGLLALPIALLAAPRAAHAATITVNTTADDATANGNCTLREAIQAANTNAAVDACAAGAAAPTQDAINFSLGSGTPSIAVSSTLGALPAITERVTIDGSTGGATRVELNGGSFGAGVDGLEVTTSNVILRKLVINRFTGDGIEINGSSATGNSVEGCFIGTDTVGVTDQGNAQNGVLITAGASQNTIGGTSSTQRNIIAGNDDDGVEINGATSATNTVSANFIGMAANGTADLGNTANGVLIAGSPGNTIGGTATGQRNIISGNDDDGIEINATTATLNTVLGNYIGTTLSGVVDLGNTASGVFVTAGATVNQIGGNTTAQHNVIAGNDGYGVRISGSTTKFNTVKVNWIGVDASGVAKLWNEGDGVFIDDAPQNTVGCTSPFPCNVIGGRPSLAPFPFTADVLITGGNGLTNTVLGNYIGVGADGNTVVGAWLAGVMVIGSSPGYGRGNVVGCTSITPCNVIAGANDDIRFNLYEGSVVSNATVIGNQIGLNAAGTVSLSTSGGSVGIRAIGCQICQIGGTAAGSRNVVAGEGSYQMVLHGSSTITVEGNYFDLDPTGTSNSGFPEGSGISIQGGGYITIGGTSAAARNIVASPLPSAGISRDGIDAIDCNHCSIVGNDIGTDYTGMVAHGFSAGNGIELGGTTTACQIANNLIAGNHYGVFFDGGDEGGTVTGNTIGLASDGVTALGNLFGVVMRGQNALIGGTTAPERNIIAGNSGDGVVLLNGGPVVQNNKVEGNYIGVLGDGTTARGNGGSGILLLQFDNETTQLNTIGGNSPGTGNVISGNSASGIRFEGAGVHDNVIEGNIIGLAANGLTAVPNGANGLDFIAEHRCVNFPDCTMFVDFTAPGPQRIGTDGDGIGDSAERNIISGNTGHGIYAPELCIPGCSRPGAQSRISGNLIGLAADGLTARGNGGDGIRWHANDALIGSNSDDFEDAVEANRIAYNGGDGIRLENSAARNSILRNEIFANGCVSCTTNLGIDLQTGTGGTDDGVTANDTNDADSGTNDLMNYPVLTAAQLIPSGGVNTTLVVTYSADVKPAECSAAFPCRVEFFFTGETPDPSGNGEGRSYLGFDTITGDVTGQVATLTLDTPMTACGRHQCMGDNRLSATLTNSLGGSSFQAAFQSTFQSTFQIAFQGTSERTFQAARPLGRQSGPAPFLGSTSEFAADIPMVGLTSPRGDCNGDFVLSAADVTAETLEIFDGDGTLPANAPDGTFVGIPVGCNSNADGVIDAGDLSCMIRKLFGGVGATCGP